ncbi:hypothetical protein TWF694_007626 [Orbilia ellipsospora]|uniref:MaoC-like domain-containing protein n=1 Tax=Orbilia ellipsospora TaxID=2528407 RepID=A0AAV9XIE8_9PEZI
MSEPGVGHEFPEVEVSWCKRDLLLFANSIGCKADELHFLYELHPKFSAFPTYPIILPFKHTDRDVIDFYRRSNTSPIPGIPKLDAKRVVDGERKIEFKRKLPVESTGRTFVIKSKVLGVYDKGKPGTVVETEQTLVEKVGSKEVVFTRAVGSGFYVGQGGWGGPKGPKTINYPPPEGRASDATYTHPTNPESALLYRLNGDYNPLHATPEPGQKMGFGGAIMHGLFSWNTTAHGILQALGESDPANLKEFQARFASPVKPGDTLVTEIWRVGKAEGYGEGWEELRFITSVKGGKVCLSNGRAVVKISNPKSKL